MRRGEKIIFRSRRRATLEYNGMIDFPNWIIDFFVLKYLDDQMASENTRTFVICNYIYSSEKKKLTKRGAR